jgi:hypothetical protein
MHYTDIHAVHGGAMVDSVPRTAPQILKARGAHDVRFAATWGERSRSAVLRGAHCVRAGAGQLRSSGRSALIGRYSGSQRAGVVDESGGGPAEVGDQADVAADGR